jgi:hypothetical protein
MGRPAIRKRLAEHVFLAVIPWSHLTTNSKEVWHEGVEEVEAGRDTRVLGSGRPASPQLFAAKQVGPRGERGRYGLCRFFGKPVASSLEATGGGRPGCPEWLGDGGLAFCGQPGRCIACGELRPGYPESFIHRGEDFGETTSVIVRRKIFPTPFLTRGCVGCRYRNDNPL